MKKIDRNNKIIFEINQLEEEIRKENERKKFRQTLKSTVFALITVAALAVIVSTYWMPVLKIYGSSMTPSLREGDVVLSIKSSKYKTGDIVGLHYGNKLLVKRIIAGPGDVVDIDYKGNVCVNGLKLEEKYIKDKTYGEVSIELPYQVPENRWFVLGDHRSTSIDSRNHLVGSISDEQVVGRLVFRAWPLDSLGRVK